MMTNKNTKNASASKQLTPEEYAKIKEKRAKSKLQLNFPPLIIACALIPLAYLVFMVSYYVLHLRLLAQH